MTADERRALVLLIWAIDFTHRGDSIALIDTTNRMFKRESS